MSDNLYPAAVYNAGKLAGQAEAAADLARLRAERAAERVRVLRNIVEQVVALTHNLQDSPQSLLANLVEGLPHMRSALAATEPTP